MPMEVVFPTPLTPMKRNTLGVVETFSSVVPTSSRSTSTCRRAARTDSWSWSFSLRTFSRRRSTASVAVSTPRSARISVSSSSSKKASSASVKVEKRLVVIFFSLSKKPMASSWNQASS